MTILECALAFYGFLGTTASVINGFGLALDKIRDYTAEDLFKRCFIRAVKRKSGHLAHFTESLDLKEVDVDRVNLDRVLSDLKDLDASILGTGEKQEILNSLSPRFRNCIILPGHELSDTELDQHLSLVLRDAIADFYDRLPITEQAFRQILFKSVEAEYDERSAQDAFRTRVEDQLEKMAEVQKDIAQRLSYLDPTVILKESGRTEFKNPFRIVKAEEFDHNYPLLAGLFRKPANYDLICGRDNLILAGGRGCGKSMILRSLTAPTAVAIETRNRDQTHLLFKEAGIDYFGVYIKLAKGYFDDWRPDSALTQAAATQLFQHSFNMQLLKATIDALIESRDRCKILSISSDMEGAIVAKIGEILGLQGVPLSSFADLRKAIVVQEQAVGDYLGALRLGGEAIYSGRYTYVNDFPKEFCRIILDLIPDLEGARIYFLLDEFENLAEFQQTVVNTITKLRPTSLTLKLATRALGVKSRVDLQGEPIQSPRDYQMVSLDYDVRSSEYNELLLEISEKRLQEESCLETNIKKLLPSLGPYSELGEDQIKVLVAEFLRDRRQIDFSKISSKDQNEWIHRMGVAVTFRKNEGLRFPKLYCGFEAFVDCSSGIISNFLELCKMAFYLAESSGQDVRDGAPICPRTQNEAIYLVSCASLDWIPRNIPQTGPRIGRLVLDLRDIFRQKLLRHDTEPEAARIVIKDPARLDDAGYKDVTEVLDDAVKWSVMHALGASAYLPKHKTDLRPNDFTLNRILIPTLRISGRPRWRTEFRVQDIAQLLDPDREVRKKRELMRKHSGQIHRKDKEKSQHPSLFDNMKDGGGSNE